jgi:hypothetical protein
MVKTKPCGHRKMLAALTLLTLSADLKGLMAIERPPLTFGWTPAQEYVTHTRLPARMYQITIFS